MNRYKNARIAVARPAPAAVLDFVDAARPRWDGQPETRPERPRDTVAAVSLVGSAGGGAGAGADAPQGEIRRLLVRAVFPRKGGRPSLVMDADGIAPFSMAIYGLLMCGHENATCFWSRLHVVPDRLDGNSRCLVARRSRLRSLELCCRGGRHQLICASGSDLPLMLDRFCSAGRL